MSNDDLFKPFSKVVRRRRSVRGFLPDKIDLEALERIFDLAQWSPSNCNTQPWQVYVAGGSKSKQIKQGLAKAMERFEFAMDFPYDGQYQDEFKVRQRDAAAQLYRAMGIERSDKEGRHDAFMRNFEFFDAPYAAFLFMPGGFGLREAADVGMYAQNLMLALSAYGLASCPQTALSFHADLVRKVLEVPNHHKLLFGIAFGYEDTAHVSNKTKMGRADIQDAVRFHLD